MSFETLAISEQSYIFLIYCVHQLWRVFICLGVKKGFMFKKKKVDNVWQSRFFVLDSETLKYYKKITVSTKISIFKLDPCIGLFCVDCG